MNADPPPFSTDVSEVQLAWSSAGSLRSLCERTQAGLKRAPRIASMVRPPARSEPGDGTGRNLLGQWAVDSIASAA